jgi:hypothetical protein
MYVLLSLRPLRRPEIGVHRGQTERRFGVPREPGRWSCGALLCGATCRPLGWQKQMLKVCVNPPPVPIDAPLRESSTGGAYGTSAGSDPL